MYSQGPAFTTLPVRYYIEYKCLMQHMIDNTVQIQFQGIIFPIAIAISEDFDFEKWGIKKNISSSMNMTLYIFDILAPCTRW